MTRPKHREATLVAEYVARFYGMASEDVTGRSRAPEAVQPRHVAVFLCRKLTDASYPAIANVLGELHHTSAVHAEQSVKEHLATDARYAVRLLACHEYVASELAKARTAWVA